MKPNNNKHIILGPLLGTESDEKYTLYILVKKEILEKSVPILNLSGENKDIQSEIIESNALFDYAYLGYSFDIAPLENVLNITYFFSSNDEVLCDNFSRSEFTFQVCALNATPNIAFVSCNGSHKKKPKETKPYKYNGYKLLKDVRPDYLFFMGDVIYADHIMDEKYYKDYFYSEKQSDSTLEEKIDKFYLDLYIESWTCNEHLSLVLATIPNIMSWDDHDIIDGYGSHLPHIHDRQEVLFKSALKYYRYFQLRQNPNKLRILKLRNYTFVLPDTRIDRTPCQVIGPDQYAQIRGYLDHITSDFPQMNAICFVLPVPIAHMDFTSHFENLYRFVTGFFKTKMFVKYHNDDVLDHWDHEMHYYEQIKMLDIIFEYGEKLLPKYLIIASGDVHCSGAATIVNEKNNQKRYASQIIASPIVNDPPGIARLLIYGVTSKIKKMAYYTAELLKFGTYRKNIYARSFILIKETKKNSELHPYQSIPYLNCRLYLENKGIWHNSNPEFVKYKNLKKYKSP